MTSRSAPYSLIPRLMAFGLLLAAGFALLVAVDFDIELAMDGMQATHPLVFVCAMTILPLLGFPISAFYLFAGAAFPWWQAWMLCIFSLGLNISLAWPISRHLLHVPLSHILERYRKSLPTLSGGNQFRVTFLVRSVPGIPYFMQNYLLPLLGIPFVPYLVISWSIQSIFAAGMAAVPHLVNHSGPLPLKLLILLLILILLAILQRFYLKGTGKPGN